jgi:TRAP-type C4-dicarboxylate transport system substrate-binding protein
MANITNGLGFGRLATAFAAVAVSAGSVAADELNYSVGFGPNSLFSNSAEAYAEYMAEISGGDLTIRVFPLSLVSLPEMGPGIRDGLTDMGFMAGPYYPAEFAHSNFLAENSLRQVLSAPTGREGAAYAGAMTAYIMTGCPECLEEYEAQNHVYMGHMSTSPYLSLCNGTRIETLDDVAGVRFRSGGSSYQRMAEHFDGVGVQLAASEAYEALNQGLLDCAWLSASDLTSLRLIEIVDSVTVRFPGNVYGGSQASNVNRQVWEGLSTEQRELMLRGAAYVNAHMTWSYYEAEAGNLDMAREQGIEIIEPSAEMIESVREYIRGDMELVGQIYADNYGITRGDEISEEFVAMLERWNGLVGEVNSIDDLAELYWTEIYSNIDPATYGLN